MFIQFSKQIARGVEKFIACFAVEIFSDLNDHMAVGPNTWKGQFLKLFMAISIKLFLQNICGQLLHPNISKKCIRIPNL